ncbi:MAG: Hsp20/alpha crystallin family protein [Caldimonas sp.]
MFVLPVSRTAALARRAAIAPAFGSVLDRLFDESFDRCIGGASAAVASAAVETRTPSMDVTESDLAYTVVLDVPGSTREQLKVSVEGRRVALTSAIAEGATAEPQGQAVPAADAGPADRVLYRERSAAVYARTIVLPAEVDQTQSQAKFENGVLTLTLAKKVPAGATQLSIA